jgi:replicative DNA helicase
VSEVRDNVRPLAPVPHGRVPPQSLDAERSVLGGILLDNAAFDDVVTLVTPADFYREAHRKVFEAMISLSTKAEPIDRVTLKSELVALGALELVGGEDFLDLLDKLVPSASNLGYYANIVHEKGLARRTIEAAHAIAVEGYEQHGDVREFVDRAEARMYALRADETRHEVACMRDAVTAGFKRIERRYEHKDVITGVPSGVVALDHMTTGFQPGELVYIGARPSMGKSALMLDSARATCRVPGDAALVVSVEMPKDDLVDRAFASESGVNLQRIRTGRLLESDWSKLAAAAGRLSEMELHINDSARTTLDVRAIARRTARTASGCASCSSITCSSCGR